MKAAFTRVTACMIAASLTVAAQEPTTDKDALYIPVYDLTTEKDLRAHLAEHYGDDIPVAITPELTRVFEAIENEDDDLLREILSEIAGKEILLPSDLPKHDNILPARELLPTEEVLARMRPEHVEALADHRHVLEDRRLLFEALDKWEGIEHAAVIEFYSKMRKPESIEDMIPDELREQRRQARERGWYPLPGPAIGSHLLSEVSKLDEEGKSRLRRTFSPFRMQEDFTVPTASYVFDLPGYEHMEVVHDTKFGGALYIEKSAVADVHFSDPNLLILGHDAAVRVGRHEDGVWVTKLSAFDGWHRYEVTLEKRLDGEEREEFVRLATDLIERVLSQ